jgi:hypothetical protein
MAVCTPAPAQGAISAAAVERLLTVHPLPAADDDLAV